MIGIHTLHPHDFRHSGATLLKNMGMDLEDISKLLNHKGLDVTQKHYIKVDPTRL
jgi:integrase